MSNSEEKPVATDRRVALVTGGSNRVGRAIVLELAQAGFDVAVHVRRPTQDAEQLAEEVSQLDRRATTICGDLTQPSSWPAIIEQTVDSLERLDVLVNNAATFETPKPDSIEHFDPDVWNDMLTTNVTAIAGLCHHARVHLESARGVVLNLCDISAERPWPDHLAYCCSKAALVALTRGLARSLAPSVRVNGVAPGVAVFPESFDSQLRERIVAKVPLKRAGTAQEVARLVRFLVENGDYITGQIVHIDGGRSIV